ncbi:MAG: VCBS repeat-containing protein, partial [Nitrospira sp.]|nr:VCBS repeat-containing protein [Nitrospira sp.]
IPNSAYIKNMVMLAIPPPNPLFPNLLPRFSVGVDGKATTSDEVTPVPAGASVTITGVQAASYPIINGNYNIPQSLDPNETGPALAYGHYLLRVKHPDFLDTYNDVTLGFTTAATSSKDLQVYSRTTVDDYASRIGGQKPGLGLITGRVIRNRDGRATAGVSIEVRDASARNTLPVLYFDETTGQPNPGLSETTRNGRYVVFNVPQGLAFISVTSTDDTGNAIVLSFADGVTVRDIGVNEAPPPFVKARGTVRSLKGDVVDGVSLTALGGDPVRDTRNNLQFFGTSTNATGEFEETVSPLNQLIIRGRKDSGFYPTYNFGFQTSARDMVGADLLVVSRTEVLNLLSTETIPIQQDLTNGIITGTALVQDFGNPNSYCSTPTGTQCSVGEPIATVGGFFNEDIVPDLAVLNRVGSNGVGSVAVFFGDGNGGFRTPAEYDVGQRPTALGMGDFNKDNNLDLVAVNSLSNSFSVLLGTRSGRFPSNPIEIAVGGLNPTSVAVGDANGDTNLDLFITSRDTNTVDIFLGDGRGGFSQRDPYPAPIMLPTGCGPVAIALTILDNDTLPDWAIACEIGNRLELLISGFGKSRFEPGPLPLRNPKGLIVDDFNRDGGADIGVVGLEADVNSSRGMLTVLVSNALRQVPPPSNVLETIDISPESIMPGDFNSDGRRDLVVTGRGDAGDPNVQIFLGNGDGTFQKPPISKTIGVSPRGIVAADLNIDGSQDIAVVDPLNRRLYTLMSEDILAIPDPGSGFTYQVEAVDLAGRHVGEVRYITPQGTLTPDHTKSGGKFLILNVPPGIIFTRTFEGSTGNRIVTVYPDSVSNTKISLAQGILTSVPVLGVTLDAVARPIGDADITFLGNGSVTFSSPLILQANSVVGGATYDTFLEANSEFIAKLTKVGGGGFPPVPGDFDFDSIPDNVDDCPGVFNPDQTDTDADNIGDACDPTPTR